MTEIKIMTGVIDCHFQENFRIALDNLREGRPLFEGQRKATVIPDPRFPEGYMVLRTDG